MANQYVITVSPPSVDMSLTVTLTFTVTYVLSDRAGRAAAAGNSVPPNKNTVMFQIPYGDTDGALTPDLTGVPCTPLTDGWDCGAKTLSSGIVYVFWPLSGTVFNPGDQAQMSLPLLISTKASGPSTIQTLTTLGGVNEQQNIVVQKDFPPLAIRSFTAAPQYVGKGQTVELAWQVTGASEVDISPTGKVFPAPNRFLWNGKTTATPYQNQSTTTFEATAKTGDGQSVNKPFTVYLCPPTASLTLSTNGPIDASDATGAWTVVNANWTTQYAQTAFLSDGQSNKQVALQATSAPLKPGASLIGSVNFVTETLTANGYSTPAKSAQTITFNPARILYFKFVNPDLTGITFQALGSTNGGGQFSTTGGVAQFLVEGPGGPLTQYLGKSDSHTQVMYFNAAPDPNNPGTVTLSYITNNATNLQLMPGGTTLPVVPNFGVGTTSVMPKTTTNYILTATGPSGTVTSTLTVTV